MRRTKSQLASASDRRLRVRVTRASLSDSTGRALRDGGCFSLKANLRKQVYVEGWEDGRSDRVFHAPFPDAHMAAPSVNLPTRTMSATTASRPSSARSDNTAGRAAVTGGMPVDFVNVLPAATAAHALVDVEDDFEIAFVGMVVPPFDDGVGRNANELLLYSVRSRSLNSDANSPGDNDSFERDSRSDLHVDDASLTVDDTVIKRASASRAAANAPFAAEPDVSNAMAAMLQDHTQVGLAARDVPTIHFDPDVDGSQAGTIPNVFVTIPASKSVLFQGGSCGSLRRDWHDDYERMRNYGSVGIRFTVLEMDRVTNAQAAAIANAADLGSVASSAGSVVPYANLISWAFTFASSVGSKQLERYMRPDYVMSTDFAFRLVRKQQDGSVTDSHGNPIRYAAAYLRYGYYFFLDSSVDAKLYAQTDTSSQHVPLLLRRDGYTHDMAGRGEKEMFEMTGVSYVVIKVTPGRSVNCRGRSQVEINHDRVRLDHLLHMTHSLHVLANSRRRKQSPIVKLVQKPFMRRRS